MFPLDVGVNTIEITVATQQGTTTYVITVTLAAPAPGGTDQPQPTGFPLIVNAPSPPEKRSGTGTGRS